MLNPYIHRCVVREGDMVGNKTEKTISHFDILYEEECPHCGEPLVTLRQLIAHIYEELVNA
jgi:hypothetical protein